MNNTDTQRIRNRAWHFLSPQTAVSADMTLSEMQRFISGGFKPSEPQLRALATRMNLSLPDAAVK